MGSCHQLPFLRSHVANGPYVPRVTGLASSCRVLMVLSLITILVSPMPFILVWPSTLILVPPSALILVSPSAPMTPVSPGLSPPGALCRREPLFSRVAGPLPPALVSYRRGPLCFPLSGLVSSVVVGLVSCYKYSWFPTDSTDAASTSAAWLLLMRLY